MTGRIRDIWEGRKLLGNGHQPFSCSNSTMETLQGGVKYAQS